MKASIIKEPCNISQNDGSKFYYAIKIDDITFRCSEYAYPGNEKALEMFTKIKDALERS